MYLSLFGYRVDAVVANRLLPDDVTDPWFEKWRSLHAEHLATIESSFAPLPVLRAALADEELVGPDRLRAFGAAVYGDHDPVAVLHEGETLKVSRRAGAYHLTLELPFAEHDDLDVGRKDDELLIRVGPYRRALVLPDSLRRRGITDASLRQGKLRVVFAGDEPKPAADRRRKATTKREAKGARR
jgi:arsenite-transporting ATPase